MQEYDQHNLTEAVIARLADTPDARTKEIMTGLVRHLHDFAREVKLTETEWMRGIDFLTATGQLCDDKRQEFILLSDVLGLSMLTVAMNHEKPDGCTESTVFGPSTSRARRTTSMVRIWPTAQRGSGAWSMDGSRARMAGRLPMPWWKPGRRTPMATMTCSTKGLKSPRAAAC